MKVMYFEKLREAFRNLMFKKTSVGIFSYKKHSRMKCKLEICSCGKYLELGKLRILPVLQVFLVPTIAEIGSVS